MSERSVVYTLKGKLVYHYKDEYDRGRGIFRRAPYKKRKENRLERERFESGRYRRNLTRLFCSVCGDMSISMAVGGLYDDEKAPFAFPDYRPCFDCRERLNEISQNKFVVFVVLEDYYSALKSPDTWDGDIIRQINCKLKKIATMWQYLQSMILFEKGKNHEILTQLGIEYGTPQHKYCLEKGVITISIADAERSEFLKTGVIVPSHIAFSREGRIEQNREMLKRFLGAWGTEQVTQNGDSGDELTRDSKVRGV